MKVKMIKDLNVGHTWIQKGEVLKVRVLSYAPFELSPFVVKPFQVIEGEYSGEEIPVTHCIVLEEEEKTYSEAEYNELKRKLEQANREKELLKEEINELIQERKTLLEQIERTVDERKVQLPRKVAEALDWHKKKVGFIGNIKLFHDYLTKILRIKLYLTSEITFKTAGMIGLLNFLMLWLMGTQSKKNRSLSQTANWTLPKSVRSVNGTKAHYSVWKMALIQTALLKKL